MLWREIDLEDFEYHYGEEIATAVYNLLLEFDERFRYLGVGRNRATFVTGRGRYVIKVPITVEGMNDNYREAQLYDLYSEDPEAYYGAYGRARLHHIMPAGIPVLFMEYLDPTTLSYDELPNWVKTIDSGQVGWDREGRLKAYDYGNL